MTNKNFTGKQKKPFYSPENPSLQNREFYDYAVRQADLDEEVKEIISN